MKQTSKQSSDNNITDQANSLVTCFSVFCITMVIYVITLAPTVTGEDSGELIAAANEWGVSHPPGYPLWTIITGLGIRVLHFGSVAYRANLVSALLSAASAVVLCNIMRRFFSISSYIAAIGSICFACSRHVWSQAVIAEVYTLHILLACLIIYFALAWKETGRNIDIYITALLTGLALANHHLAVLLGPVLFMFVLACKPKIFISPKVIILCLLFLAVGLTPYLYLPAASSTDPYVNWGNIDSMDSFLDHVLRRQYSDTSMHMPRTFERIAKHCSQLFTWLSSQFTMAAIPFMVIGACLLAFYRKGLFIFTLGFFLMHTIVFAEILNFSFDRQELFCARVFFLPVYIIAAIWFTFAFEKIKVLLIKLFGTGKLATIAGCVPIALLTIITFASNYSENNMSGYYYAFDHAENILNSLEENAIIVPSGDHNTFPLIYLHNVEGIRKDIIIADKYGYIEYDLYKSMPDAVKKIRTRRQREEIEAYLVKDSGRPVYYTVKPRMDLMQGYKVVCHGMLYRICKNDEEFSSDKLPVYKYRNLNDTKPVTDHAATVILSDYHFHLASNALRQERNKEAMGHINTAATLSEGLKEEMNNLGTLLAEFNIDDEAIKYYEQAAKLDINYLTPRWNLAYLFKAKGDTLHAIQVFNDLSNIEPEDHRIFGELGFLLYDYGEHELAVKNWAKSLALQPNQPQIIKTIAEVKPLCQ